MAIVASGCLPTKFLRALEFLNIAMPSTRTFFRHQLVYVHGVSDNLGAHVLHNTAGLIPI